MHRAASSGNTFAAATFYSDYVHLQKYSLTPLGDFCPPDLLILRPQQETPVTTYEHR